jgi:hypothetical protein
MGWLLFFVPYVLVLAWAIEVVRRLGDHTKLLERIAADIAVLRAQSTGGRANDE